MPLRARELASVSSWALSRFLHTITCPESRIRHPYTHEKHGVYFRKSGNLSALFSSSAYHLMTLPVRRPVIRPSFASVTDTLQKEFANKHRLYENIYSIDNVHCLLFIECIHPIIYSHIRACCTIVSIF